MRTFVTGEEMPVDQTAVPFINAFPSAVLHLGTADTTTADLDAMTQVILAEFANPANVARNGQLTTVLLSAIEVVEVMAIWQMRGSFTLAPSVFV